MSAQTACVIGAGIIGSWTAVHLAEAGIETTLIEQFPLPHDRGSSHGASRAFRFLGDEPLDRLFYSLDRWRELELQAGDVLYQQTGLLNFGPAGDAYLEKHMTVLEDAGRPCTWLDGEEVAARYPMLDYPPEWGAAWDPGGGILFADRCLRAVQSRFRALGGDVVTATAESVSTTTQGALLSLRTGGSGTPGTRIFDHAVVCAGPWTARLLPGIATHLRSLAIPVTYWRDPDGAHRAADGFPILFNARLTGVYALPSCEPHGHVKVLYHGGPESDPDKAGTGAFQPYIDKVARYVQTHLPLLEHDRPARLESCRYTMTPDSEPILDRFDECVAVGCGFSGSGFKHAPATGHMLAALALGRERTLPPGFVADRYRLGRFG
ncbi:MAG: FAD-dependent oxidoreductase [Xanthomonadales bacterium]|nr:FAD-dependent oxidoreductase [Xanthomonadales bacterium]NIX12274.1 FAD-dependent oxidoreductase [Xanthomonadales bacterium]